MDTENKPFVLSLSKHEWHSHAPSLRRAQGDRTNVVSLSNYKLRVNGKKYVFSIMDSLVTAAHDPIDYDARTFDAGFAMAGFRIDANSLSPIHCSNNALRASPSIQ